MIPLFYILRSTLVGLLLLGAVAANAQAPAWQRALVLGQAAGDISSLGGVQADGAGNLLIVGSFTGSVVVGNTRLTSTGADDLFVAKWSRATNSFIWAISAGGSGSDFVQATTFSNGSLYLTGMFKSPTCTFGTTVLTNAGSGSQDIYVAKVLDAGSSGSFGWAQRAGGNFSDSSTGICVTATGVFIAGVYSGTATFGSITLPSGGGFVAKISEAGTTAGFAWAQQTGSLVNALAASGSSIYLIGNFSSSPVTFGAITLTSAGGSDVFVLKMTDTGTGGNFVWGIRAGGTGTEAGFGAAASGASVYVAGFFASATCAFGSSTLASAGTMDAYLAKVTDFGASGAFVWGRRVGGTGDDYAVAATAQGNNIYLTGSFSSPTVDAGATVLANAGTGASSDVFLAHLVDNGASGDFAWAQQAGGAGNDNGAAAAISGTEVALVGRVAPPASFGPLALTSASAAVGFLATLTDATALPTAAPAAAQPQWSLVPNPARTTVRLVGAGPGTLTLFDALGRVVRAYSSDAGSVFDVADLPKGLYVARLERSGEATTLRRLLVE